eukprot:8801038-Lingulodinium_polyedra.AAC.1
MHARTQCAHRTRVACAARALSNSRLACRVQSMNSMCIVCASHLLHMMRAVRVCTMHMSCAAD